MGSVTFLLLVPGAVFVCGVSVHSSMMPECV